MVVSEFHQRHVHGIRTISLNFSESCACHAAISLCQSCVILDVWVSHGTPKSGEAAPFSLLVVSSRFRLSLAGLPHVNQTCIRIRCGRGHSLSFRLLLPPGCAMLRYRNGSSFELGASAGSTHMFACIPGRLTVNGHLRF